MSRDSEVRVLSHFHRFAVRIFHQPIVSRFGTLRLIVSRFVLSAFAILLKLQNQLHCGQQQHQINAKGFFFDSPSPRLTIPLQVQTLHVAIFFCNSIGSSHLQRKTGVSTGTINTTINTRIHNVKDYSRAKQFISSKSSRASNSSFDSAFSDLFSAVATNLFRFFFLSRKCALSSFT